MITLVKWHQKELDNIRREMEELFDRCFERFHETSPEIGEWKPCLDLLEVEEELIVRAELPGLEADDLDISVQDRTLTIEGHKRREKCAAGESYRCMERNYGHFFRRLELPCLVDTDNIEAVFKNGVLTIVMPKWKQKSTSSVEIEVK